MNIWKIKTGIGISALFIAVVMMSSCKEKESVHAFLKGPYLQNPLPDGMTVMWESRDPGSGEVRYGETERLGQSAGEFQKTKIHQVMLNGLKPHTKYFYQVVTNNLKSEIHGDASPFNNLKYCNLRYA